MLPLNIQQVFYFARNFSAKLQIITVSTMRTNIDVKNPFIDFSTDFNFVAKNFIRFVCLCIWGRFISEVLNQGSSTHYIQNLQVLYHIYLDAVKFIKYGSYRSTLLN